MPEKIVSYIGFAIRARKVKLGVNAANSAKVGTIKLLVLCSTAAKNTVKEAVSLSKKHGAKILEANYRRPTGEIDIIAKKGRRVLFVEVKRRSSLRYGRPSEAVNPAKQAHILRTAQLYLQENGLEDAPVRFDVIEVLPGEIRHIEGAFDASALR